MAGTEWRGALWLARDFCLLDGHAGSAGPHAHYAHQVLLARERPVCLLLEGESQCADLHFVESLREHALVEPGQPVLAVYAEPLRLSLATLRATIEGAMPELDDLAERLLAAPRIKLDPRVERALTALDAMLAEKISAQVLAREACLSLSQLERLFGDQVGLSVRRLVLWRRLRLALRLALEGQSLTRAAFDAGFADAAHFSRTMRATFGIRADHNLARLTLRLID